MPELPLKANALPLVGTSKPSGEAKESAHDLFARRRRDAMLMAFLSFLVVLHRRWSGELGWVVASEAFVATLCYAFACACLHGSFGSRHWSAAKRHAVAVSVACIPLFVPTLSRWLVALQNHNGAAWEMVMLTTLGLAATTLVISSRDFRYTALSVISSGFLMLFATSISDSGQVLYLTVAWVVLCLYWLVANHWERLEVHLAQTVRHERSLRVSTTALGVFVFAAGAALMWGREPATELIRWGFMPTSGGQRWADSTARSGVGDGDSIVAAKEHAASFGPVESELFLQSDLPSLFDMFDDTLGEIVLKRRSEKAVALPNQTPVGEEQKFAKSEKGSASFSTARDQAKLPENLKDRSSPSILQWIGPTGVGLAMERFAVFDGVEWKHQQEPSLANLNRDSGLIRQDLTTDNGQQVWYFRNHGLHVSELQHALRSDAIKFINLKSARIPAPADSVGIHIADVDRDDFFAIAQDGSWYMPQRETVPSLTVIRMVSREVDGDVLKQLVFPTSDQASPMSDPDGVKTRGIMQAGRLASAWTSNTPAGWPTVQAITSKLRSEFRFDRRTQLDAADPLFEFLHTRQGGDHLFATAAVVMLQSLGYQARLVTGFYADPTDYNRFSGQTEIDAQDAHVWGEVLVADGVWVPFEPTPGYAEPRFHRTFWNLAMALGWASLPWLAGFVALTIVLWFTKAVWGEWLCRLAWVMSLPLGDHWRLAVLVRMLDIRSRLAGVRRPPGVTPRRWFSQCAVQTDEPTALATRRFFDAADLMHYSSQRAVSEGWVKDAQRVASRLTVRQLIRVHQEVTR